MEPDLDELFERLGRSDFRRRFRLRAPEREYLKRKGLDVVLTHGQRFIEERLAPADPPNNGTATCCRGCLATWHAIPKGQPLTDEEKAYILSVLRRWLIDQGDV
jgi:Domain of unknown function (DUF4186)